jgi:hypothetical protein
MYRWAARAVGAGFPLADAATGDAYGAGYPLGAKPVGLPP